MGTLEEVDTDVLGVVEATTVTSCGLATEGMVQVTTSPVDRSVVATGADGRFPKTPIDGLTVTGELSDAPATDGKGDTKGAEVEGF